MNVHFYAAAEQEFDAAVEYYEARATGLGKRFREAVKEALTRIQLFPEAYPPFSKRTRRCLVSRFPYGIIYRHSEEEITVVAVAHLHRQPEYWQARDE